METFEELFSLADDMKKASENENNSDIKNSITNLEEAAVKIGKAFSGSWLGYHSCVYYNGLQPPPPGAHFSQEWGLNGDMWIGLGSTGDWQEYNADRIKEAILHQANVTNMDEIRQKIGPTRDQFSRRKADLISILMSENQTGSDGFLAKLLEEANKTELMSPMAVLERMRPRGQVMTRDTTALGQGTRVPPHVDILASVISLKIIFTSCNDLSEIARKAASHLERKAKRKSVSMRIGTNVFIGHGRSSSWRELKDFLQDRLHLPWDEFNRVPVAGITNITRLSEMLDTAAVAFLIMTAEDELADGGMQARMNVIHEAGLFQGRLGFARAIVLLEDSCSEFSNISGLGQIRFPQGKIHAVFEQVRQVLEREGILNPE